MVVNKFLKKLFRNLFKSSYKRLSLDEFESFNIWLKHKKKITIINQREKVKYSQHYHPYYLNLLNDSFSKDRIINGWNDNTDFEINNNFQRFHLFELLTEKEENLKEIIELINTWIVYYNDVKGEAWSGFNSSMRAFNWLKLLSIYGERTEPTEEQWKSIQNSLHIHSQHIMKNIEHHIPGNHVLLQYFSLWLLYKSFPKWRISKKYISKYEQFLFNEINNEFLECGFHFEQSFHYHIQITLMSLIVIDVKRNLNEAIPQKTISIIRKAVEIINNFKMDDGYLPMLGDNCFNFFNPTLFEDTNQINILASLIVKDHTNENNAKTFDYTDQYLVAKTQNSKIIFDVGNIGLKQNPGHGHSDLSSFIYSSYGTTLFIDPGTKKYSNDSDDLILKRSSSHNTLSINSYDQAVLWGFFRWAYLPKKMQYGFQEEENKIILENQYEGFRSLGKITHKRQIVISDSTLTIFDYIYGKKTQDISFSFILTPNIEISNLDSNLILSGEEERWELSTNNNDGIFHIESQEVYPSYDVPFITKKITFKIKSVNLPFKNIFYVKHLTS